MRRTPRVLTSSKLRTNATSSMLNVDRSLHSIAIGRRIGADQGAYGLLGKVNEHSGGASILDHAVWLDLEYPHVIGIFGSRGSGKSFDLGVICECVSGLSGVVNGNLISASVILFDVQNQFWTLALHPDDTLEEDRQQLNDLDNWGVLPSAIDRTRIWNPAGASASDSTFTDFKLSPSQLSGDDWLNMLALERYSAMGQALLQLVENWPSASPGELATSAVPSRVLNSFQDSTIDGVRWRLQGLAQSAFIGEPGIDINELLLSGYLSVIMLRNLPDNLRQLVVGVLTRLTSNRLGTLQQQARLARRHHREPPASELPKRVWLVLDEAHVLVPSNSTTAATEPVIDYVKRGRDAGLSLVFATQQPSAVDSRLMSQVDLTLTHTMGFEVDIAAALQRMPTRTSLTYRLEGIELSSLNDAIRTLDPGDCMVADTSSGRVFAMRVRPRATAHGGNTPV